MASPGSVARRAPFVNLLAGELALCFLSLSGLILTTAQHAQVSASSNLAVAHASDVVERGGRAAHQRAGHDPTRATHPLCRGGPWATILRGVPNGVGQSEEVILAGWGGFETLGEADDLPAARGGEGFQMHLAQVVGLGLAFGGQGPENDGLVRIHAREGRDSGVLTAGSAATTHGSHPHRLPLEARGRP